MFPDRARPAATVALVGIAVLPARFLFRGAPAIRVSRISRIARRPTRSPARSSHVSTNSFADLGASRPVVDALTEGGITFPFPVQRMVLPGAHAGPPRGPDAARRRRPRPGADPRPRRGGPHARHGVPAGRRPHREPHAPQA